MSLHLVHAPEPPPLPVLPTVVLRRPGERHEVIAVPTENAAELAQAAACSGISLDLSVTLLAEAELAVIWLRMTGRWENFAAHPGAPVALSAAEADYLRALTVGRKAKAPPKAAQTVVSVPVRLVARCSPDLLRGLPGEVSLEQAIAWEAAALREGLQMGEWLMRQALLVS
ncbi:MAG: hypothetical protein ACLGI5_10865 [Thermoleophilia bacterium]